MRFYVIGPNLSLSMAVYLRPNQSCQVSPKAQYWDHCYFLAFINDIADNFTSEIHLFADDSILYHTINSIDDHKLQQDLTTLQQWANTWQMDFNISKCAIMTITRKHNQSVFDYTMKGQSVPQVRSHDYLGVHIKDDLNWDKHIGKINSIA